MRMTSTDMQNNFGKYLKLAEAGEDIIVTRNGRDIAKLIAYAGTDEPVLREGAVKYTADNDIVTYEDFLELTEGSEQRHELIDGVVYNMASPSYNHQHSVNELHGTFYNWFKGKPCTPLTSPLDITLKKEETNICVVQPDLVIICDKDQINEKGNYMGTPDLVIEVLSPSTRSKDMIPKLDLYRQCGVKEYWIIDPMKAQVILFSLSDGEIADVNYFSQAHDSFAESKLYPGLQVSMQDLFA